MLITNEPLTLNPTGPLWPVDKIVIGEDRWALGVAGAGTPGDNIRIWEVQRGGTLHQVPRANLGPNSTFIVVKKTSELLIAPGAWYVFRYWDDV